MFHTVTNPMERHTLLLVLLAPLTHAVFNITILHTNDMHGMIDATTREAGVCITTEDCYGGFGRIKYLVDSIKKREDNVLYLDAGDNFQGGVFFPQFKEKVIAPLVDMLGIDAMALGNHEFDEGPEVLGSYLRMLKTPTVAANIITTREPYFNGTNIRPYEMFTVGGQQIAVVGYITPSTQRASRPNKVIFMDEIPYVRKLARRARQKGAKLVIALGHSGFNKDCEVAHEAEEIDIVVGGHSHTLLSTGTPPDIEKPESSYPHIVTQRSGKRVPVVQAFAFTKYLGYLQLSFDNDFKLHSYSGQPILLTPEHKKDDAIEEEIKSWLAKLDPGTNQLIGRTTVDLDSSLCRHGECIFGNFLGDSFVYVAKQHDDTHTLKPPIIGLVNSGVIRVPILKSSRDGFITMGDLSNAMPFTDTLAILNPTGQQLKDILETAVKHFNSAKEKGGGFLQFSGLQVTYDIGRPQEQRVKEVLVLCEDCSETKYERLVPTRNYTVVTSTYVVEKHKSKNIPVIKKLDLNASEAFASYLKKKTPITPKIEQRITIMSNGTIVQDLA